MKPIKVLFFFSIIFHSFQTFAQQGYSISIDTKNAKGKILTISYFKGTTGQKDKIDSVQIANDQQTVKFKNTKKILGAVYQLGFTDEPKNTINIIADNGADLKFSLEGKSLLLLKPQDKLNKDFILFQTATTSIDDKKTRLQNLSKAFLNSVVALFSKFELKKLDAALAKADSTNLKVRNEYFKGIDLQDKRIPLLPNAYSFLFEYMNLLPITNDNYQDNVELLFKNMDCGSRNYMFYLDWVFKNLSYYQRYNLSNTYRYVYSMYLDKDSCKKLDEKFYTKITEGLKKLDELPIGTVIPAFDMEDSSAKTYNIQQLYPNAKYTFLAFYDPDCSHCQEMMPKVEAYFESGNEGVKQVQKIAFVNSKDCSKWAAFIKDYKLANWLNVKPMKGDTKYLNDLKVFTNPQFFLLDKKGTIILKSFNVDELNAIFKK